jgi:hypothetical protein
MSAESLLVGAIVLGAVGFLLRGLVLARRTARHGGCDRCGT